MSQAWRNRNQKDVCRRIGGPGAFLFQLQRSKIEDEDEFEDDYGEASSAGGWWIALMRKKSAFARILPAF